MQSGMLATDCTDLDCLAATDMAPMSRASVVASVRSVCSGRVDAYLASAPVQDLGCTRIMGQGNTAYAAKRAALALRVAQVKALLQGRLQAYLAL